VFQKALGLLQKEEKPHLVSVRLIDFRVHPQSEPVQTEMAMELNSLQLHDGVSMQWELPPLQNGVSMQEGVPPLNEVSL
jgi:hypothetical protein